MKKLLLVLLLIGAVVFLVTASGDVRSVIGWLLTGYLLLRAFPGVRDDLRSLSRLRFRGLRLRPSKVDTL